MFAQVPLTIHHGLPTILLLRTLLHSGEFRIHSFTFYPTSFHKWNKLPEQSLWP